MRTKLFSIAIAVLSIALVALFIPIDDSHENHHAFAVTQTDNKPLQKKSEGIQVQIKVPSTIHATQLTPVDVTVTDSSGKPISHVDWAISVKDPKGNVVYKTTTAHSHTGKMNFNAAFPTGGQYTISLTGSSIGPKMMGMDVPPKARTHTMISGSLMGFESDPENNFGSRSFDFPIQVQGQKQIRTLSGSEPGSKINVELSSNSDEIVAGKPATLILTTTNANGKDPMLTHVDALIKVRKGNYITSSSDERGSDMMPMNGAYHGHLGQISFTTTFPSAGNYIINADLNSLGVSNAPFGMSSARFNVLVSDGTSESTRTSATNEPGKVNIVGLEAPFYSPNTIKVKAGQTMTFDNVDGNFHTVTSGSSNSGPDGKFDSGLLSAGDKFTLTLDKPGTYQYFCTIHPNMVGTIQVS